MRKRLVAMLAAGCSSVAMAGEPGWTISEASGPVQIGHAGITKVATRGLGIAAGDVVTTGPGGRAVLVRGPEYMMVAASSRLRLPAEVQATGFFQVVQEVGNVVFMIKKKMTPHFEVKTPYLAAVVKGTTFSVGVTEKGASVQVLEGAVDVATPDGGAHDLLRPGSVAVVGSQDLYRMRVETGGVSKIVASPTAPVAETAPAPVASGSGAAVAESTPADAPMIEAVVHEAPVSLASVTNGLISGTTGGGSDLAELASISRSVTEASASAIKAVDSANVATAAVAMATEAANTQSQAAEAAAQSKMAAEEAAKMAAAAAQQAAEATAKANADKASSDAAAAAARAIADAASRSAAAAADAAAKAQSDTASAAADQAAKTAAQAALDAANAASSAAAQEAARRAAVDAAKISDDATKANAAAALAAAAAARQQEATKAAAAVADDAAKAAAKAAKNAQSLTSFIIKTALDAVSGISKGK